LTSVVGIALYQLQVCPGTFLKDAELFVGIAFAARCKQSAILRRGELPKPPTVAHWNENGEIVEENLFFDLMVC